MCLTTRSPSVSRLSSSRGGPEALTSVVEVLLGGVALLLLLPVTVLFAEVVSAVANRGTAEGQTGERPRIAVVMPAHNEATVIKDTLRCVTPQLDRCDRLLVVADNCSDETATLATTEGAEVLVRRDLTRRGKGYALDFGIRHLKSDPPQVVVMIDADCQIAPHCIDRLARLCAHTARPVQALYLMRAPRDGGLKSRIAEFAWVVKNHVRPLGLHRLGLPCQLMGTGMAFPWSQISRAELATGHIVEDLKLGIDLAHAGSPPLFCPEALVTSDFPSSSEGIQAQRTRWEHGHLSVILSEAPRLILDSMLHLSPRLSVLALDLSVPPLALLALQVTTLWVVCASFYFLTKIFLPFGLASAAVLMLALAVMLSWGCYGRHIISLGNLVLAPIYALWKVPLYARFLVARQLDWVRSKRAGERPPPGEQ